MKLLLTLLFHFLFLSPALSMPHGVNDNRYRGERIDTGIISNSHISPRTVRRPNPTKKSKYYNESKRIIPTKINSSSDAHQVHVDRAVIEDTSIYPTLALIRTAIPANVLTSARPSATPKPTENSTTSKPEPAAHSSSHRSCGTTNSSSICPQIKIRSKIDDIKAVTSNALEYLDSVASENYDANVNAFISENISQKPAEIDDFLENKEFDELTKNNLTEIIQISNGDSGTLKQNNIPKTTFIAQARKAENSATTNPNIATEAPVEYWIWFALGLGIFGTAVALAWLLWVLVILAYYFIDDIFTSDEPDFLSKSQDDDFTVSSDGSPMVYDFGQINSEWMEEIRLDDEDKIL